MRVKKSDIIVVLSAIAVFHSILVYPFFGTGYGRIVQLIATMCLLPMTVQNIRIFLSPRYLPVNIIVSLLAIWLVVSSYFSRAAMDGLEGSSLIGTAVYAVAIVMIAVIVEVVSQRSKTRLFITGLFLCSLFYTFLSFINIPFADLSNGAGFFIGTKFEVSYMAISSVIFYASLNKKFILTVEFWLIVALAVVMCIVCGCTTALLGLIVSLIILAFPHLIKILSHPSVFLIVLLVSDSILLLFSMVLEIPVVSFIIEDLLHKDITLTSRMNIYEYAPVAVAMNPIFGYGYGNSFNVCLFLFSAPNCQNGILDFALQTGIPGVILLISAFLMIFRTAKLSRITAPICVLLYMYIIISSVEITFSLPQLVIAMLLMLNADKQDVYKIYR